MIKIKMKIVLVIILTLFFSLIDAFLRNSTLLVSSFFCFMIVCSALVVLFSLQRVKQIDESIPTFLNFVNLTMSTGKSFANAFEIAILYQSKSLQPFYKRIYRRIFYLKDQKSFLFFQFQKDFYQKLFQISLQSNYQQDKINQLKLQMIEKMELKRKEKSIKAPFWTQIYIFSVLYLSLLIWHYSFRQRYFELEVLSLSLFVIGLLLSLYIGRPKKEI